LNDKNQQKNIINFESFGRKHPRLSIEKYPLYHDTLCKLGKEDISWRVDRCNIDGIGIECCIDPSHRGYVPVGCDRRTCPQCSFLDMRRRYDQFFPALLRYTDPDMIEYNPGYRLRFWTFTCRGLRIGQDMTLFISQLKKSLFLFWRNVFGERSKYPDEEAGGVFFIEVQGDKYWCPHCHALIWSKRKNIKPLRDEWEYCLRKYNHSGSGLWITKLYGDYEKAIYEVLSYPVKPDKDGRHDKVLLAYTESALSGKRRYFMKGSFCGLFPNTHNSTPCDTCEGYMVQGYDYKHERRDFWKNAFPENIQGLKNYVNAGWMSGAKRADLKLNTPTVESLE